MKKIFIFLIGLIVINYSFSQTIWETLSERTAVKSSDWLMIKGVSNINTEKVRLSELTSISDSTYQSLFDSVYFYTGLNTSTGRYVPSSWTNYLKYSDFTTAGLTPNLFNADYILDSILYNGVRWTSGTGTNAIIQKNCNDSAQGDYSLAIGRHNEAINNYTFVHGRYAASVWNTGRYYASGTITGIGEGMERGASQGYELTMYTSTSSTTTDTLIIGGNAGYYMTIPTDAVITFNLQLTAVQYSGTTGTNGTSASWTINGVVKNIAGRTQLVGSVDTVSTFRDSEATDWTVSVSADDTEDALLLLVTGGANRNVYWVAKLEGTIVGIRDFDIDD